MLIANRVLTFRSQTGDLKIPIGIHAPEQGGKGSWFCRYEIGWPDKKSELSVGGFDSTQALFAALQIIGAEIYASNYHKSGNLFWEAPGNGYGFPVASGVRHFLEGDDAKYL